MTDLDRLDAPRTCTFCGAGVDPRLLAAVRERDELWEAALAVVGPRPRRREWKSITRLRAALHREHVR